MSRNRLDQQENRRKYGIRAIRFKERRVSSSTTNDLSPASNMRHRENIAWLDEAQRREERRAEARLAEGLQRLDKVCSYHLNTVSRAQRQLHQDLGTIRAGYTWRKNLQSLGSQSWDRDRNCPLLLYKRTLLPIIPQNGREADKNRSQKTKSRDVGGISVGLQARLQEFMGNAEPQGEGSTSTLSLPDLDEPTVERLSISGVGEQEGPKERKNKKESLTKSKTETIAPDSRLRTVHTLPSFPKALAEAHKARYLRHRGQPISEQELSVGEIFGRTSKDT